LKFHKVRIQQGPKKKKPESGNLRGGKLLTKVKEMMEEMRGQCRRTIFERYKREKGEKKPLRSWGILRRDAGKKKGGSLMEKKELIFCLRLQREKREGGKERERQIRGTGRSW